MAGLGTGLAPFRAPWPSQDRLILFMGEKFVWTIQENPSLLSLVTIWRKCDETCIQKTDHDPLPFILPKAPQAFIEQRKYEKNLGHKVGPMTLFFGGRHAHAEYYYRDEPGFLVGPGVTGGVLNPEGRGFVLGVF